MTGTREGDKVSIGFKDLASFGVGIGMIVVASFIIGSAVAYFDLRDRSVEQKGEIKSLQDDLEEIKSDMKSLKDLFMAAHTQAKGTPPQ